MNSSPLDFQHRLLQFCARILILFSSIVVIGATIILIHSAIDIAFGIVREPYRILKGSFILNLPVIRGPLRPMFDSSSVRALSFLAFEWGIYFCINATILFGSWNMLYFRRIGASRLAALMTVLPCVATCFPIGLIAGVTALLLMQKDDIRQSFHSPGTGVR